MVSDFRNLLHHHVHQEGAGPATTFWAGLGAIRRDSFLRLGGFDSSAFPNPPSKTSISGCALSPRRANRARSAIQGKHLKRWTLGSMARTDLLRRGVPWVRLLLDQRSASTALNLSWRRRAGAAASLGLVAAAVAGRPRLAAWFLMAQVGLNQPFYSLLLRKRGPATALGAIPLQVLHDLTSAVAVPLGVAAHMLDEAERQPPRLAVTLASPRQEEADSRRGLGDGHE